LRGVIRGRLPRLLVMWLAASGALLLTGALLSGVDVTDARVAALAAALVGVLNALAWPVLIRLALPLTVLTLGAGALMLNGAVMLLVARLTPGLDIDGLPPAVAAALALTATTALLSSALAIDEEDRMARHLVRRAVQRAAGATPSEVPGVLFLEIDGLAHEVLRRALRDGNAPTLARWLREGTHRLAPWETDWSSQTGACQAGLLHGCNEDMPAFRWWEKDRGRAMVTSHPRDAAEMERRVSDGRGLLHADGASRANILSGDAPYTLLTLSTVLDLGRGRLGRDYFTYFASPYNVAHTFFLALADVLRELRAALDQRRRDVQPRVERDLRYALVRAWATVVQRDLQVETVLGDVYAGRPVVYTTFLAYDEVAHHSGIERADALAVLRSVDRAIGRIARAATRAPRPYEIVVLSDHGQSQGATFRQRYGVTLEEIVEQACATADISAEASGEDEALGRLGAALTEVSAGEGAAARAVRSATRRRRVDGEVRLGEEAAARPALEKGVDGVPEISVMASGCLGLISFPRIPGRVTLEELERRYPRLLPTLGGHPGVGFLLVRSQLRGAVVIGQRGVRWLDEARVEGEDPLAPFGPNAGTHVARTDRFDHCPDIVVNSAWWGDTGEVAAFEELVGSHGGLGGPQTCPFVLAPAHLALPAEPIVGAETLHGVLRGWLAALGHEAYGERRATAEPPAPGLPA
jgi:uncharacterized membrane protein YvlD (DUF360 family)